MLLALLMSDGFKMRNMASSMPICTPGSFQCQVLLSDLFDRAVKLSHYIHSLSTEMYEDLDQRFSQGRQFLGKSMSSCHTSSLSTPEDKDQALQTHHDDLINLVQKLLRSWNQPLQHLALEAPDNMASKVKEVEEHAKILQGGIDRIAGRMQSNLGDDFYPQWFGPLDPRMPKGDSESYALYHLLHCFRRDSNKIDNYLKILRCRMVHASNC
uniref:Prolactin 2 n=1 Tax=Xenopus laevis TaxID=8355 RepID=C6G3Z1_XENLA|nr:prolactin, gene 2 L homeolog [Xenopus laevis]ACQ73178.1 prolactin 2 [Xenopus laevis]|eukprot:XP_017951271.1 PREDICTED: prolactin-2-like [Xenopus tropicalis]